MSTEGLKIPAKHYVGMVKRENETLPLAFITPYGEDSAAKKRMSTVDDWVSNNGRWYKQKSLPTMVIDNKPLSGFKITSDIRTTSYGGLDKWRIEDPRGFELEITSANLARLMSVGMIDRGEINDQCVWARIGANNVLLSTNTDEYEKAIANTKVASLTANWKDVKVGNGVVLQNNLRGVWLGRMHYLERSYNHNGVSLVGNHELVAGDKSLHVILVEETPTNGSKIFDNQLHLIANPKLAEIDASSAMTDAQAEIFANEMIGDPRCQIVVGGYKSIVALSVGKININEDVAVSFKNLEINSKADLESMTSTCYYDRAKIYVKNEEPGKLLEVSGIVRHNGNMIGSTVYDMDMFNAGKVCKRYRKNEDRSWYGGSGRIDRETHSFDWNPNQEYGNIKIAIQSKSGNVIETLLK